MTALGSTICVSSQSRFLRSAPVRSGPILPPSPNSVWQAAQLFVKIALPAARSPGAFDRALPILRICVSFSPAVAGVILPQCFSMSLSIRRPWSRASAAAGPAAPRLARCGRRPPPGAAPSPTPPGRTAGSAPPLEVGRQFRIERQHFAGNARVGERLQRRQDGRRARRRVFASVSACSSIGTQSGLPVWPSRSIRAMRSASGALASPARWTACS